jgi:hypothetical protein
MQSSHSMKRLLLLRSAASELYQKFPELASSFMQGQEAAAGVDQITAFQNVVTQLVPRLTNANAAMPRIAAAQAELISAYSVSVSTLGGMIEIL